MNQKVSIGRIVLYALDQEDADHINKRRRDAQQAPWDRNDGTKVHIGEEVREGEVFPMVVTRVVVDVARLEPEVQHINGQVLLDGNDTIWKRAVQQDVIDTESGELFAGNTGVWGWPPRV